MKNIFPLETMCFKDFLNAHNLKLSISFPYNNSDNLSYDKFLKKTSNLDDFKLTDLINFLSLSIYETETNMFDEKEVYNNFYQMVDSFKEITNEIILDIKNSKTFTTNLFKKTRDEYSNKIYLYENLLEKLNDTNEVNNAFQDLISIYHSTLSTQLELPNVSTNDPASLICIDSLNCLNFDTLLSKKKLPKFFHLHEMYFSKLELLLFCNLDIFSFKNKEAFNDVLLTNISFILNSVDTDKQNINSYKMLRFSLKKYHDRYYIKENSNYMIIFNNKEKAQNIFEILKENVKSAI